MGRLKKVNNCNFCILYYVKFLSQIFCFYEKKQKTKEDS